MNDLTLCLETTSADGSLCLGNEQGILTERVWTRGKSHSEVLSQHLDQALKDISATAQDLRKVIVDIGPGSFTGIRVGVNAARALGFAQNILLTPVHSLEILAWAAAQQTQIDKPVIALLNAHKNLLYTGIYQQTLAGWKCLKAPFVCSPSQLDEVLQGEQHLGVGDGLSMSSSKLIICDPSVSNTPFARTIFEFSKLNSQNPLSLVWNQLIPLYLRASEAEEKRVLGRL